jgi:hypothetical protein
MFIYVVEEAAKVSNRYHAGGGIVIVAESFDAALELANKTPHVKITAKELSKCTPYKLADSPECKVFIFPDAGCC